MNFKFLLIDGVLSLNTSKMSDYIERSYYIANEKKMTYTFTCKFRNW